MQGNKVTAASLCITDVVPQSVWPKWPSRNQKARACPSNGTLASAFRMCLKLKSPAFNPTSATADFLGCFGFRVWGFGFRVFTKGSRLVPLRLYPWGTTWAHRRAILGLYWANLIGVQSYWYNPGTIEFRAQSIKGVWGTRGR